MPTGNQYRRMWRMMPDRTTVTYRTRTGLGEYADAAVANCWWRPGQSGELQPSYGVVLRAMRDWYVPKEMRPATPNVGDLVVNAVTAIDPAAVTWTAVGVSEAGALGAWKIESISLQIRDGLGDAALFERPTTAKDQYYRESLAGYATVAADVPCRLQPQDGSAGQVMDRVTIPYRFDLYVGVRVAVRARDRVTVAGTAYTILSSDSPERLDALQHIVVEQIL